MFEDNCDMYLKMLKKKKTNKQINRQIVLNLIIVLNNCYIDI